MKGCRGAEGPVGGLSLAWVAPWSVRGLSSVRTPCFSHCGSSVEVALTTVQVSETGAQVQLASTPSYGLYDLEISARLLPLVITPKQAPL